jgi:hypothetical protein
MNRLEGVGTPERGLLITYRGRKLVLSQHVAARMNRWEYGRMNSYSEDLRRKTVSAVGRGMPKAQAARTFSPSLSSVKRYANKAERGESLAPKKAPGSAPKLDEKAMKLPGRTSKGAPSPPSESAASTWRSSRGSR